MRASDVMTPDLVQVPRDPTIPEIARVLCENRVHRVLVTDGGRLIGLISTFDLVGVLNDPTHGESAAV